MKVEDAKVFKKTVTRDVLVKYWDKNKDKLKKEHRIMSISHLKRYLISKGIIYEEGDD